jgi:hypothetical protein
MGAGALQRRAGRIDGTPPPSATPAALPASAATLKPPV